MLFEFLTRETRPEDIRERARALASGGQARAIVVSREPDAAEPGADARGYAVVAPAEWRETVGRALAAWPDATLVLAGEEAIELGRACADFAGRETAAWPTTLSGDATHDRAALDAAVAAQARGVGSRDSLWDGDYLLVPGAPDDAAATLVIEAFAQVAEDRPSLDLVFLADPIARFETLTAELQVRWRVHWAGAAPLRAECTWLSGAGAVVLTDREVACASRLLRALGGGAPLRLAGGGARIRNAHAWLESRGALSRPLARDPGMLAEALADLSPSHAVVRSERDRALRLAREHDARALAATLAGRWLEVPARRAAAA